MWRYRVNKWSPIKHSTPLVINQLATNWNSSTVHVHTSKRKTHDDAEWTDRFTGRWALYEKSSYIRFRPRLSIFSLISKRSIGMVDMVYFVSQSYSSSSFYSNPDRLHLSRLLGLIYGSCKKKLTAQVKCYKGMKMRWESNIIMIKTKIMIYNAFGAVLFWVPL